MHLLLSYAIPARELRRPRAKGEAKGQAQSGHSSERSYRLLGQKNVFHRKSCRTAALMRSGSGTQYASKGGLEAIGKRGGPTRATFVCGSQLRTRNAISAPNPHVNWPSST